MEHGKSNSASEDPVFVSESTPIPEFVPMRVSVETKEDSGLLDRSETYLPENFKLPQVPKPAAKMRSINWQKLPESAIFTEKSNFWKNVLQKEAAETKPSVDFVLLEGEKSDDRIIGRPLNWATVQLADPIEYDWISVKIFSILLCNYISHRIKSRKCIKNLLVTR